MAASCKEANLSVMVAECNVFLFVLIMTTRTDVPAKQEMGLAAQGLYEWTRASYDNVE